MTILKTYGSTMKFFIKSFFAVLFCFGLPTLAGTELLTKHSEADYQVAYTLFEAMQMPNQLNQTLVGIIDMQMKSNPKWLPYRDIFLQTYSKYLSYEAMKQEYADIYLELFTVDELKELTTIYQTPVGKKFAAVSSELAIRGANLGQQTFLKHQSELETSISRAISGCQNTDSESFMTYNSQNEPKAEGLNFNIKYPAKWISEQSESPHVIHRFIHAQSDGDTAISIAAGVGCSKLSHAQILDSENFFTEENIRSHLPNNAEILISQKTKLNGLDAMLIEYRQQTKLTKGNFFSRGLNCFLVYKNYQIVLATVVAAPSLVFSEKYFEKYKPTFMKIFDSFVILDNYD